MSNVKEKFPKDMAGWIMSTFPEYDQKLGISKPCTAGLPIPSDDPDLDDWKAAKMKEFEETFKTSLNKVDRWRKRFKRKYINRKWALKNAAHMSSSSSLKQLPILMFQEPTPSLTTGRRLFEQKNSDKFSEAASQLRLTRGQPSQFHAGYWMAAASAAWKKLSDKEKAAWEEEARSANQASNSSDNIYKNQDNVAFSIYNALRNSIGPQPHQIGCAAYHVLYGYRDLNEQLVMGTVQVVDNNFIDIEFDKDFKDYDRLFRPAWNEYCSKAIGSNRSIDYAKVFSQRENGIYVLPPFDEEKGTACDLRQTLKTFFEASWDHVWPRSLEMPALPWCELVRNPDEYLHPRLGIELTSCFSRIENMSPADLRILSGAIVMFQSHPDTNSCSIFLSRDEILDARTQRSTRQELEEVDAQEPMEVDRLSRSPSPPPIAPHGPNPLRSSTRSPDETFVQYGHDSTSSMSIRASITPTLNLVSPTAPQLSQTVTEGSRTDAQTEPFIFTASRCHSQSAPPQKIPSVALSSNKIIKKRKRAVDHDAQPEVLGLSRSSRTRQPSKKAKGLNFDEKIIDNEDGTRKKSKVPKLPMTKAHAGSGGSKGGCTGRRQKYT